MQQGLGTQPLQRGADVRGAVAVAGQEGRQQPFLDAVVARAVRPVIQVAVAQLVRQQLDHPILGGALGFADVVRHATLPVGVWSI